MDSCCGQLSAAIWYAVKSSLNFRFSLWDTVIQAYKMTDSSTNQYFAFPKRSYLLSKSSAFGTEDLARDPSPLA